MPRTVSLVAAVFFLGITSRAGAAESSEAAIAGLESYFRLFAQCRLGVEEKEYATGGVFQGNHIATRTLRFVRDMPRWRQKGESSQYIPPEGKWKGGWQKGGFEIVCDGQSVYSLGLEKDKPQSLFAWSKLPGTQVQQSFAGSALIDGWLPYNRIKNLLEVLRDSHVTYREEAGGLLVVEGVGRWGKHTVWLDPARGYVPLKIIQEKRPEDWSAVGKPLSQEVLYAYGKTGMTRFLLTLTVGKVGAYGGHYVPTEYTLTRRYELTNGKSLDNRTTGQVFEVNLSPQFSAAEFSLQTRLPDGFPVTVPNEPGIRYEWQDGKLIKSIDQDLVRSAEGRAFLRGRWFTKIAVAAAVVIAAAVTVVVVLRRRKAVA